MILQKSRGVVGVPTNGDMLGEPVISVCYLKIKGIGKQNQVFLEITNFTPHDFILSLAYIVKFEL